MQFQLTINLVAVATAVTGAVVATESPLTAVQVGRAGAGLGWAGFWQGCAQSESQAQRGIWLIAYTVPHVHRPVGRHAKHAARLTRHFEGFHSRFH